MRKGSKKEIKKILITFGEKIIKRGYNIEELKRASLFIA
ncbi:hypothetical protein HRbin06_00408 [archaeon HR06]|nr:hypothetical protein HRbin06_00408 [archaeon HR06]